jgi:SAM-dependent methyltransferase
MSAMARLLNARREIETTVASHDQKNFSGFCSACTSATQFQAGGLRCDLRPSLNDEFICGSCRLSGRLRGVLQVFRQNLRPQSSSRILALDCNSPTLSWLRKHFSEVTVREFLTAKDSLHPEDKSLNNGLPFNDNSFDYVLALGDYSGNFVIPAEALREFYRVAVHGGSFVLSRAASDPDGNEIDSACVEKKDDAASVEGPTTTPTKFPFDWDDWRTIDSLKQAGYPAAHLLRYWSFEQKILGDQRAIIAQK